MIKLYLIFKFISRILFTLCEIYHYWFYFGSILRFLIFQAEAYNLDNPIILFLFEQNIYLLPKTMASIFTLLYVHSTILLSYFSKDIKM